MRHLEIRPLAVGCLLAVMAVAARAQSPGDIDQLVPIGGELLFPVDPKSEFGQALTTVGDLDGNGTPDLAVGAPKDKDGLKSGAVWLLFLASDGSLVDQKKISQSQGGLGGQLDLKAEFGSSIAPLGDLDGDGTPDIAVGAPRSNNGGHHAGAVWVLFMNPDGTVKAEQKISITASGPGAGLSHLHFGTSIAALGDVNGDGVVDLAVGAVKDEGSSGDDDGDDDDGYASSDDDDDAGGDGPSGKTGSLYVVFLQNDGTAAGEVKITEGQGGFDGDLAGKVEFGASVAPLGDLNGDGTPDVAVGSPRDSEGGKDNGAAWLLFLGPDGQVVSHRKIVNQDGTLLDPGAAPDEPKARFGAALAAPGDIDDDGVFDLLVGAPRDDDAGEDAGAVYLLGLGADGAILASRKYSAVSDESLASLADEQNFGGVLGAAGDIDGNGTPDLLLGVPGSGLGLGFLAFTAGLESDPPYVPSAQVFDGKPGRSILVPEDPDAPSFEDFIDQPVVVVTNSSGSGVSIRVGSTTSVDDITFGEVGNAATGGGPIAPAAGDFVVGSDVTPKLLDLVVANRIGDSFSFLQSLPGPGPNYAPQVEYPLGPDNGAPVAVVVEDFDVDGFLDAAFAGDQGVSVFFGDGAGGFPTSSFTPVPMLTDLAVGFVNGDAIPDLITTSGRAVTPAFPTEEGFATVLLGNGDGTFTPAGTFADGTALASVLLGTIDGDGLVDVLLAGHALDAGPGGVPQGSVALWVGDGSGGFAPSSAFGGFDKPSAQGIHPTLGALGDLDGDGDVDAIYSSNDSIAFPAGTFDDEQPPVELTVLVNDGLGSFAVLEVGTAYVGKGVAPILGDIFLDPNGDLDAILVWYEDESAGTGGTEDEFTTFVTAFQADEEAGFIDPASTQFATGDEPTNAAAMNVDSDGFGRIDVVVPNLRDNSLTVLIGDGNGGVSETFTVPDVAPLTASDLPGGPWIGGPRSVGLGDMDGDGFADGIVYSDFQDLSALDPGEAASHAVLTVVNNVFGAPVQDVILPRGGELAVGDMNGGGRVDAVVTQRKGPGGPDEVRVYLTREDGTLDPAPLTYPMPEGVRLTGGILIADVDNAGRNEVVTTAVDSHTDRGLLVTIGLVGSPVFIDLGPAWTEVRGLARGDLDNDGQQDVAIGLLGGGLLAARGFGDGTFAPYPLDALTATVGGGAIAIGDVDGDGLSDIITSTDTDDGQVDQAFVRLLRGEGGGSFKAQTVDALQSTGVTGSLQPLLTDLDANGAPDLVLVHGTADSVSFLVNQLSIIEQFGAGKPGSGQVVPELTGQGFTRLGGTVTVGVSDALPGAPGLLQLGTGKYESGMWHVQNVLLEVFFAADAGGAFELPLLVPHDPAFVGLEVVLQALLLDPGAGPKAPLSLSATNGLSLTFIDG